VSAEIHRRGTPEHPWVMLASFVIRQPRAAIQTNTPVAAADDPIKCAQMTSDDAIADFGQALKVDPSLAARVGAASAYRRCWQRGGEGRRVTVQAAADVSSETLMANYAK
jgi:uncharacterized Zn-binding protein involved in type VI secretion